MQHFAAIIFDMDGLLLDTETVALAAFLKTCTHFGLPEQKEVFIRCLGTNQAQGREVLKQGLRDQVDHLVFDEVWSRHYTEHVRTKPISLKDGVVELLAACRAYDPD